MSLNATITNIALINQLRQIGLLTYIAEVLVDSPTISHLLVRGSLVTGRADRSSDVDLVIGVQDLALSKFITTIDTLIRIELGSLLPGWHDSLSPDMGGAGFVYLIPFQNTLYELDLYVVSESSVSSIVNRGAKVIFTRGDLPRTDQDVFETDVEEVPWPDIAGRDVARNLVVEILVLLHMMSKRVKRQQSFIVYGHTYLLNDAVRRLIKHCLVPQSRHWGWYNLADELSTNPQGDTCLRELDALISAPPIRDTSGIQDVFTRIKHVIASAVPELCVELKQELEAYRHYMRFL